MALELVTDSTRWNTALAALPYRHVLQTWEWGQFKGRWGWTPRYFLNEEHTAAALVLRRTFSPLKLNILYVPKGPVLDYSNSALVDRVLRDLAAIARRDRAIFVKIDPDLDQLHRSILLNRGWRY